MKSIVSILIITTMALSFASCSDDKKVEALVPITDADLFNYSKATNVSFYKNNSDTLPFTPNGGGHGGFIRVKFNLTAFAALTDSGRLPASSTFSDGSLIIKDIYDQRGGALSLVAVMYKKPTDANAAGGWVWGEYFADGRVAASVTKGRTDCLGCHSFTSTSSNVPNDRGHRDYVRTFGLRP